MFTPKFGICYLVSPQRIAARKASRSNHFTILARFDLKSMGLRFVNSVNLGCYRLTAALKSCYAIE